MNERGSVTVLAIAISAVILVVGLMMVTVAGVVSAAFHARTAAEAAALAAVSPVVDDPRAAARGVAALNGARLVRCECPGRVRTGRVHAHVWVETVIRTPFFGTLTLPADAQAEYVPG